MSETELVLDARNIVGESLIWDDRRGRLVWVDIIGRRIHRLDPLTLDHETWDTSDFVTSIGLCKDGAAIVGLRKEIALWDFGGPFRTLARIEPDSPDTRLNEGVVAPDGSFWVGSMMMNIGPDDGPLTITRDAGQIYRVGADGDVTLLSDDRFGITNTMAWTADGRFITADTLKNQLYSYRWNSDQKRLDDRRPFFGTLRAARRTGPAWTPTATSGTVAWRAEAASCVSRPTGRWIGSWSCRAAGRRAAPLAARTSIRCSSPRPVSR